METYPVYLRSLELDDMDRIHKWHNNPALYQTLTGTFRYVSRVAEEEWLRKKLAFSTQEVNLSICLTANSQHIGNSYLQDINWIARHAAVGMFLGESGERSKRFGEAAMRLLMKHAFQDLGLLRLYGFILADNKASIRMVEKCGWVAEGTMRKHFLKDGKLKDVLVMAICAEESAKE